MPSSTLLKKLVFFAFMPGMLFAQTQISGIVFDSKTKAPLPYATVITNTNFGELADHEGKFHIKTSGTFNEISISYIGYKTVKVPIEIQDRYIRIALEASVENLQEVLITAKENPALRIIRNTIENRSKNDIEKSLNSFKFNAYNKTLVTADPDSINASVDTVYTVNNGRKTFKKLDSSNYEFRKELENNHIYISEKISEFRFQRGKKKKELVLASRMAGFKQPIYELVAFTIQDYSIYKDVYTLAGTKYNNPISRNALKYYTYKILDTISNWHGESFMIYYKPKKQENFAGVEGVLYIDTQSFAITRVISEIKGGINVKAVQNYEFLSNHNSWFPKDMDIVIRKGNNTESIKLFGITVLMNEPKRNDSIVKTNTKEPDDIIYFISKTVNSNIEINIPVTVKKSASTLEFSDEVSKRSDNYWDQYRTDSLTLRGQRTYTKIDSIIEAEGIEKKIDLARSILKGYYPTKYVNLNLGKIINLNNYEGLRIGLGGETNSTFSSCYKLESYIAYGTKDKDFKYSIGGSIRLNKELNTWIGANVTNDLKEAASLDFTTVNTTFTPVNPRNLNIDKFYNYRTKNLYLLHDIQPNLESKIQLSHGEYTPVFDYRFISATKNLSIYTLSTASIGIQYNPGNEYMNSPVGKIRTKNAFPQFTFQLTKSFADLFDSDFDFTQINLRIKHRIRPLRKSTTNILIEGGLVIGDVPITHLYNSTPNYTFKNPWAKRITFAGINSFETMGYNEFISDRFAAIHIKHELRPFKISSNFKPQLSFVTRATVGDLKKPFHHHGLIFQSPKKGYFESGLEFNSLFKGFGLSGFYRYGAYKYDEWSDNLALKLTFKIRLGF